jgi:hypothetical protein
MATRRLPVIQEPTGEDAEAAARPGWQWVLIGSGLLVTIWTPVVLLLLTLFRPGAGLAAILGGSTFALAALAAGYLVGRFGARARPRHAVFAGLLAAAELGLVALLGGAAWGEAIRAFFVLAVLAAVFCGLGPWIARRKKPVARAAG